MQQINDLLIRDVKNERRAVAAAKKRNEDLRASLVARRAAIASGRAVQEKATKDVENATEKLAQSKELIAKTKDQIRGQRRRICEDLSRIHNIGPIPLAPPLSFQICGIPLPNTNYNESASRKSSTFSVDEDALSAALGLVAQLTDALQYYLAVPLPYPIRAFGSRSSIRDDISLLPDPQREFPLYVPRGGSAAQFRFDYGWFLLNKDIEALCASQGLKVVDVRHTLPNLKYLLYVCSAGTEEVSERKRGGVRGLWAGRMRNLGFANANAGNDDASSSLGGSRRGSDTSDAPSRQREEELRKAVGRENKEAISGGSSSSPGLRENVAV
ncbi:hypothetical protein C8A01DRAFT_41627 [Parachaetomium inaequale]|uniref:Autophagy-related protein 14 n=1 Tax=Parachaetomium inaequale TaxID=2588326 RepID=A0AAN6SLW7_9PEZI|nr:hypothetical protein C8A01DRAFT_41627 [Parachaetomium inaequale]